MLNGITLERGSLKARFTDNTKRLIHIVDRELAGYNGLASLIHKEQNKNIFSFAGCNYESCSTVPTAGAQWLEMASAGHGGTRYRPFEPRKPWHELVAENPVLRESKEVRPENLAAMERVGFRDGEITTFSHFYFGFVDDYIYLMIFREVEFFIFMSSTGNMTVRMPAWDYGIKGRRYGRSSGFYIKVAVA